MRIFLLTFLTVCVFRVSAAPETPFRHGRLDNGLTYYIRATGASAGKADFYLVQNVGALMEEEHQNGLAHVLEHMAFHATEHFPEGVPAFLKRRGIQDLNAYTGADETVYHIDGVPTTDGGLVDSCLLILHDWSGFLQLRADEMEIERKVILEERRQGMDLSQRMQSQLNAYLYNHSKYATHDVIGTPEVLNHFTADEVRAYYHDFYRPDQQAVIVLGDIDPDAVEAGVKRLFAGIPKRVNAKPRVTYAIPDNEEPQYCRLIDEDIPQNAVVLMKRFRKPEFRTLGEQVKDQLCREFYNQIVGERLNDFIQEEDALFLSAQAGVHDVVRHYEGQNIAITPLPGMEKEAVRQVLEQLERIHRYAITDQKLKELTDNYRLGLKQSAAMLRRMPNSVYLKVYQDHFLLGYPLAEVAEKLDAAWHLLDSIDSRAVHAWLDRWNAGDLNRIYVVQGNNPDYPFPDSETLTRLLREARQSSPAPYVQAVADTLPSLMDFTPVAGRIVKTKRLKGPGAEEWTLSNGAKVYYKHNDYESGAFNLLAGSPAAGGRPALGRCVEYPVPAIRAVQIPRPAAQRYHARTQYRHQYRPRRTVGKYQLQQYTRRCGDCFPVFSPDRCTSPVQPSGFRQICACQQNSAHLRQTDDRRLDSLRHARAAHPAVAPHPQNGYGLLCGDGLRPDGGNLRRAFPQRCRFRFLSRR